MTSEFFVFFVVAFVLDLELFAPNPFSEFDIEASTKRDDFGLFLVKRRVITYAFDRCFTEVVKDLGSEIVANLWEGVTLPDRMIAIEKRISRCLFCTLFKHSFIMYYCHFLKRK